MLNAEELKNGFAIIGIIFSSQCVVLGIATLYDKIQLWGWKIGIKKWVWHE